MNVTVSLSRTGWEAPKRGLTGREEGWGEYRNNETEELV